MKKTIKTLSTITAIAAVAYLAYKNKEELLGKFNEVKDMLQNEGNDEVNTSEDNYIDTFQEEKAEIKEDNLEENKTEEINNSLLFQKIIEEPVIETLESENNVEKAEEFIEKEEKVTESIEEINNPEIIPTFNAFEENEPVQNEENVEVFEVKEEKPLFDTDSNSLNQDNRSIIDDVDNYDFKIEID